MTPQDITETLLACRRRAWDDDTDDRSRVVIWDAYDAIRSLRRQLAERDARLASQAVVLEKAEADNERLYDLAFGGQKGGAA